MFQSPQLCQILTKSNNWIQVLQIVTNFGYQILHF